MKKQNSFLAGRAAAQVGASQCKSFAMRSLFSAALAMGAAPAFAQNTSAPLDAHALTSRIESSLGCSRFQGDLFEAMYSYAGKNNAFPATSDMKMAMDDLLRGPRFQALSANDRVTLVEMLSSLYQTLSVDTVAALMADEDPAHNALEALGSVDTGDRTSPARQAMSDMVAAQIKAIQDLLASSDASLSDSCVKPMQKFVDAQDVPLFDNWKATRAPGVYGALKTMATSYQSCDASLKPALTVHTPSIEGVKITGTYSDGIGCKRKITSAAEIVATSPYLKNYSRPALSCFDITHNPLIYSYGGRPIVVVDGSVGGAFDMFQRYAPAASSGLGIDCSAYVFTSLAAGGLKVKADGDLRASLVYGTRAALFKNPKAGGYDCFDYAKFSASENLKSGDVLAESGHVVMIENVGADPFGINHITSAADCKASNIDTSKFDFTALQSSSSYNGIGINRVRGADFLASGGAMAEGMIAHAVSACLARTQKKTMTTHSPSASLVRHSGTPNCVAQPLKLAHEECLGACAVHEQEKVEVEESPFFAAIDPLKHKPTHPTHPVHDHCLNP